MSKRTCSCSANCQCGCEVMCSTQCGLPLASEYRLTRTVAAIVPLGCCNCSWSLKDDNNWTTVSVEKLRRHNLNRGEMCREGNAKSHCKILQASHIFILIKPHIVALRKSSTPSVCWLQVGVPRGPCRTWLRQSPPESSGDAAVGKSWAQM